MKPLDNEKDINLAKSGDKLAMERLLDNYKNLVQKLAKAYYIAGGTADDLVQEGMIGLVNAVHGYDFQKNGGNFGAFAALCIKRRMLSAIKISSRNKHKALNEALDIDNINENDIKNADGNPLNIILSNESYDRLQKIIDENLSKIEKQVLRLYIDGLKYQQIAKELSVNEKSVDNALQRIRKKISKILDEE